MVVYEKAEHQKDPFAAPLCNHYIHNRYRISVFSNILLNTLGVVDTSSNHCGGHIAISLWWTHRRIAVVVTSPNRISMVFISSIAVVATLPNHCDGFIARSLGIVAVDNVLIGTALSAALSGFFRTLVGRLHIQHFALALEQRALIGNKAVDPDVAVKLCGR